MEIKGVYKKERWGQHEDFIYIKVARGAYRKNFNLQGVYKKSKVLKNHKEIVFEPISPPPNWPLSKDGRPMNIIIL